MSVAPVSTAEKIVAAHHGLMMAVKSVLPQYIDDLTGEFGMSKYDEMLRDYEVSSSFATLKLTVLDDGWRVTPSVEMPVNDQDADVVIKATKAREMAEFVEQVINGIDGDFMATCAALLDAVAYGWKVAEVVYRNGTGDLDGRLAIKSINPKPNVHVGLIVDEFGNLIGLAGQTKNAPLPPTGSLLSSTNVVTVERVKAIIFSHDPKDNDPRGRSILRSVYNPWFIKTKLIPAWLSYIQRFGQPGVVGEVSETAPDAVPKVNDLTGEFMLDGDDNPIMVSPEWALREELLKWIAALVVAVPSGYKVNLLEPTGEGKAFDSMMAWCDRAISRGILGTAQMTQEAQHESRSSKNVGQDVVGLRTRWLRSQLASAITRDIVKPLVSFNYPGDESLAPEFRLSYVEQQDWAGNLDAASKAYAAGIIDDEQLPELDIRLDLPTRNMAARLKRKEDERVAARIRGQHFDAIMSPDEPVPGDE